MITTMMTIVDRNLFVSLVIHNDANAANDYLQVHVIWFWRTVQVQSTLHTVQIPSLCWIDYYDGSLCQMFTVIQSHSEWSLFPKNKYKCSVYNTYFCE